MTLTGSFGFLCKLANAVRILITSGSESANDSKHMKKSVALLAYLASALKFWGQKLFTKVHKDLTYMLILKMEVLEFFHEFFQCAENVH